MAAAVDFVEAATGEPVPAVCVRRASQAEIAAELSDAVYGAGHGREAAAAFVPARADILLAEDLDPRDPVDRSYLVHELVHAQQFARGEQHRVACVGVLEGRAYDIQAGYVRRHGDKTEAFLFQVVGLMQSACEITY